MHISLSYKIKGLSLILAGFLIIGILDIVGMSKSVMGAPARLEISIDDKKRVFEGKTTDNMTVLDALNASSIAGNISIKYVLDPVRDEATIISLNGYSRESSDRTLSVYLNDKKIITEKIHSVLIGPGDIILVKTE